MSSAVTLDPQRISSKTNRLPRYPPPPVTRNLFPFKKPLYLCVGYLIKSTLQGKAVTCPQGLPRLASSPSPFNCAKMNFREQLFFSSFVRQAPEWRRIQPRRCCAGSCWVVASFISSPCGVPPILKFRWVMADMGGKGKVRTLDPLTPPCNSCTTSIREIHRRNSQTKGNGDGGIHETHSKGAYSARSDQETFLLQTQPSQGTTWSAGNPPPQTNSGLQVSNFFLLANLANKIGTGFGCCPFGISYVRGTVADSNSYHPRWKEYYPCLD